jgi:hypothetical protein
MFKSVFFQPHTLASLILLAGASIGLAQSTISIPDGDFSQSGGPNYAFGFFVPADQIGQLGTTPWYSELKAPAFALTSADITGGQAIISVPSNQGTNTTSAFVFQNLATPFRLGTYTLSTAFTASTPLTLSLIENSGIGLGFLNNATTTSRGTEVSSSANSPRNLSLTAVSGDSGTLTYAFTNTSFTSGNLGIELFAGYNASLSNGLLTGDSFGPVNLTFTPAAVPEPSTASLVAVGTISLGGFLALRSRRRPLA